MNFQLHRYFFVGLTILCGTGCGSPSTDLGTPPKQAAELNKPAANDADDVNTAGVAGGTAVEEESAADVQPPPTELLACSTPARPEHFEVGRVEWTSGGHSVDVGGVSSTGAFGTISGDPGSPSYATAELTWFEHGVERRINVYFASDGVNWFADEIRTYNELGNDWNYYRAGAPYFVTPVGQAFEASCVDLTSDDGKAQLRLRDFKLKVDVSIPE